MSKRKKVKEEGIKTNKLLVSLLVIVFYFLWPVIVGVFKDVLGITSGNDFVFGIFCNILLAVILISIYFKDLKIYASDFKKKKGKFIKTILIYFLITIVGIAITNVFVMDILKVDQIAGNDSILFESFKSYPLLVAFLTVVYYPLVEEIIFEKTLKDVIKNKWLFIVLSAMFFWYYNIAYLGEITYLSIVSSLCYFVGGFIRAIAFYKTDNLYVPIGIKALYNLFVTIIS